MKDILLEKSFKLTMSMSQYGLNILKNSKLACSILKYFDESNIELVSNVINNKKYYRLSQNPVYEAK